MGQGAWMEGVMAGDWIKMRTNLDSDVRIIELAALLGLAELHVVGCLWKLWAWADTHTHDGNAIRVTSVTLDRFTCVAGFADALRKVGWLEGRDNALTFPRFAEHNGQTAKKRAETNQRVAKHRNAKGVTDVTQKVLPEKRREEKSKKKDPPLPPKGEKVESNSSVDEPNEELVEFPPEVADVCQEWLEYKRQNGKRYKPIGLKKLLTQVNNAIRSHGAPAVRAAIEQAMANNYAGWTFTLGKSGGVSGPKTFAQQSQSNVAAILAKAAADDAAAGRATATAGFLGVVNGK